jgi:hypothetical protein
MRYTSLFSDNTWQTGITGAGESLTDRATLVARTREFEKQILGELRPDRTCSHLFDLGRIGMLLNMMEWPGQVRSNTRYMTIQPNEYRERPVLPDPSVFGTLTGGAVPTAANAQAATPQSGARNAVPVAVRTKPLRGPNSVSAASAEVESVNRAISGLGGPGDVSRVDQVVNRIVALPNPTDRRQCGQALQKWLKDNKLWRKDKHINKDWHKKLEELLANP